MNNIEKILAPDEKILLNASYDPKVPRIIMKIEYAVLAFFLGYGAYALFAQTMGFIDVLVMCVLVSYMTVTTAIMLAKMANRKAVCTNKRIISETGKANKFSEMEISKIKSIEITQSEKQKLADTGSLKFTDEDGKEMHLIYVKSPAKIKEQVESLMNDRY